MNQNTEEMLFDLLIKKAVYGLTPEEEKQLREMDPRQADNPDISFELTASAISLTDVRADEELPLYLRAKVLTDADRFFGARDLHETVPAERSPAEPIVSESLPRASIWNWLGWAVAAAACIVLAINIYSTRFQRTPPTVLTIAQQREQLLASAGDVVTGAWSDFDPTQPRNVRGDVVWSNSQQKGFIRFQGLPVNDKSKETYQLWIFDADQNPKTPVDGGVFDAESGDFIVPIDAKLKIQKPTMFAVTAERPGGVVVSTLGKVMAVAKI